MTQGLDSTYVGGSFIDGSEISPARWHLAFIKLSDYRDPSVHKIFRMVYRMADCSDFNALGFDDADAAPYVTHIAFHEKDADSATS